MKTILASTYAINPYKGSEDGMGWNFIYQIARFHKVIAVTRENNRNAIEQYMLEHPDALHENMQFIYFDLPYYQRFWKKGQWGAILYFWLWQKALPGFIQKKDLQFDIAHNVNFHNDWTPSYLWKLGKPFVWGPIGHHPIVPKQYLQKYSRLSRIKDLLTWAVKSFFWNYSPGLKQTRSNASHILCMNSAAPLTLGLPEARYSIMPSVASEDYGYSKAPKKKFTLISAGRLVPLKGFDLSILAFARFMATLKKEEKQDCRLVVVGSGPEKALLKRLSIENHIENYIEFIEWIERGHLMQLYKEASLFLFPSHEGAGMVVSEALSFGLPVVCLNNNGPGEFISPNCGIAIKQGHYEDTVVALAGAVGKLYDKPELLQHMSYEARKHYEKHFNWDKRGYQLQTIYKNITL